jgi:hypothetical protein
MSKTITPAEFAAEVGSTGREVRKFLRSITPREEQPGKGSRWSLPGTKREVTSLSKRFADWQSAQEAARKAREEKAAEEATNETEVEDEDLELDETE